ncbi:MAG: branched-chain amino acid ABC transporter permease [Ilumatobacteraceae bacterium]
MPFEVRQGTRPHRAGVIVAWLVAVAAIAYVPLADDIGWAPGSIDKALRIGQLNQVIAYAVAVLGLNLVIGWSGQLSLGQSAFIGLGAYTTVILVADHDWSFFATLPVCAALCFVVGLILGVPASRISAQYLAIATLALAYVFPSLVLRYDWLTGGPNGKGPARGQVELVPPSWLPFADAGRLAEPLWVYCILVVMATALFLLARNFIASRPGRALLASRDNAAGASTSGVDVTIYKAMAFAMSAVYGGLAGSMLMMNRPFASEAQFGTEVGIFLVVGLVIGGVGTISGAIPGAFVYLFVPYFVSEWTIDQSGMPPGVRQVAGLVFDWLGPAGGGISGAVFGLTLLVLVFVLPGGFIAGMRTLRERIVTIIPHPSWLADVRRPPPTDDGQGSTP